MFAHTKEFFTTLFRVCLVSMLFVAPVAGFAANHAGSDKASMKGAGLVLYVSLQRNR